MPVTIAEICAYLWPWNKNVMQINLINFKVAGDLCVAKTFFYLFVMWENNNLQPHSFSVMKNWRSSLEEASSFFLAPPSPLGNVTLYYLRHCWTHAGSAFGQKEQRGWGRGKIQINTVLFFAALMSWSAHTLLQRKWVISKQEQGMLINSDTMMEYGEIC